MEAAGTDKHMNRWGLRKEPRGVLKHEENVCRERSGAAEINS